VIDVVRDTEGIRLACIEIFEQEFQTGMIQRSLEGANEQTRERLMRSVPPLTISPGYERAARHLMGLDSQREAGLPMTGLANWEGNGLVALFEARLAHHAKHPECSRCKVRLVSRFVPECPNCGAKFTRKK